MQSIDEVAREMVGNHLEFESFTWLNRPKDCEKWTLYYTQHRDSDLLAQSNATCIAETLDPFCESETDEPDAMTVSFGHWGCGWIEGYAIRVFAADGGITDAFKALYELMTRLLEYPVLDEEDHSRLEYEATLCNIREVAHPFLKDGAPDDWDKEVFSWLWNNDQRAIDPQDGGGGYPNDESMKAALAALKLLEETGNEDDDA